MKKNISKLFGWYPLITGVISFVPLLVSAQPQEQQIGGKITTVIATLNLVIGFLFILATAVFLWGVIQFIAKAGDEAARTKAKGIMTWGIIGLAVMAAAWGIVGVFVRYFGVTGGIPTQFIPGTRPGGGGTNL